MRQADLGDICSVSQPYCAQTGLQPAGVLLVDRLEKLISIKPWQHMMALPEDLIMVLLLKGNTTG